MITMRFGAAHDEVRIGETVYDRSQMNGIQKRRLRRDVLDEFSNMQDKSKRAERIQRKNRESKDRRHEAF